VAGACNCWGNQNHHFWLSHGGEFYFGKFFCLATNAVGLPRRRHSEPNDCDGTSLSFSELRLAILEYWRNTTNSGFRAMGMVQEKKLELLFVLEQMAHLELEFQELPRC